MKIKALEQQPCEDCISRQAVDKYITNLLSGYLYDEERTRLEELTAFIWELPPVQPIRPTGRWIDIQYFKTDDTYYRPKCPFCSIEPKEYSNYCPNCGARMAESEKEEPILDKIRAEIEEERKGYPPSADEYKTINKVLQILDKYKSESEVVE